VRLRPRSCLDICVSRLMGFGDGSYALIATATDYDCWRVSEAPVTVAEVFRTLKENADRSRKVCSCLVS
jgi:purine nucleoside phosphorylase